MRPAGSAARNSGITNRGSVAFISTSHRCSVSNAATAASSEASTCAAMNRDPRSRLRPMRPLTVVVGDHHCSKKLRRAAISAIDPPTPPAPTSNTRMESPFAGKSQKETLTA